MIISLYVGYLIFLYMIIAIVLKLWEVMLIHWSRLNGSSLFWHVVGFSKARLKLKRDPIKIQNIPSIPCLSVENPNPVTIYQSFLHRTSCDLAHKMFGYFGLCSQLVNNELCNNYSNNSYLNIEQFKKENIIMQWENFINNILFSNNKNN